MSHHRTRELGPEAAVCQQKGTRDVCSFPQDIPHLLCLLSPGIFFPPQQPLSPARLLLDLPLRSQNLCHDSRADRWDRKG